MNSEYVKQALEIVGNPNVLVNLISRRVRQLNAGGGGLSRPMLSNTENMMTADIALLEIIEGKMSWEMPDIVEVPRKPKGPKRSKLPAPALRAAA